jgi:hypothetical protein
VEHAAGMARLVRRCVLVWAGVFFLELLSWRAQPGGGRSSA